MGRGGGSRAAGAIAHMEMGEVFKTAGFRRARGRARGSSVVVAGSVTAAVAGSVSRSIAAGPADAAGSVDITDTRRVLVRTLG